MREPELRDPELPWGRGFLPAVGLVLALQLVVAIATGWSPLSGELWGPDSYMRLSRTLFCEGGAACPGGVFPHTNAPFGDILHWPFLQDRLLLALAAPLRLAFDAREAILVAASVFGPLLATGSVVLVLLIGRALVRPPGLYFAGILLACQPWVFQAFASPRVDHHGLQGFLFLGMVAGALGHVRDPDVRHWPFVTGAFLGLALWVSTEALVAGMPILVGLTALWVLGGLPGTARANRDVALAVVGALTLGLVVDAPPEARLAAQYDRFSVVHWTAFTLLAVMWWGAHVAERVRRPEGWVRLAWVCAGAAVWALLMALAFPRFFGGPMVDMDARLTGIWLDQISEFVPVGERGRPLVVALHLASSLLALPAAAYQSVRGDPRSRASWRFLLGLSLWFVGLMVFLQGRWALYLHLLVPIPLAWLLGRILSLAPSRPAVVRAATKVCAAVVVMTFPFVFALPLARVEAKGSGGPRTAPTRCFVSPIIPFLADLAHDRGPGIVLAPVDWGPEIVFRTGHRVVASPYHRNVRGLLDSHAFMSATDDGTALSIARQRDIDWIVMCRDRLWFPVVASAGGSTLHARLSEGRSPPWLTPVTLPADVAGSFLVFAVDDS